MEKNNRNPRGRWEELMEKVRQERVELSRLGDYPQARLDCPLDDDCSTRHSHTALSRQAFHFSVHQMLYPCMTIVVRCSPEWGRFPWMRALLYLRPYACASYNRLGDVATHRTRFRGRPMGFRFLKRANRVTILALKTFASLRRGNTAHGGALVEL
ncbi:hypothetical protein EJ02DRAFT_263928 [Clathrospora elynae]|uniref:Uncharacterized protein n=1 Tax=Clathrospora elynae TaxID=706981 RepID=A0A6A5SHJ5_9PLEO|nr:hypothetical protein EJ02DRAFT_263928 [Clathrospora elynae]